MMQPVNITYQGYLFTTDKSKMQPERIHHWLSTESYWAKDIPTDIFHTSFDHSYTIGILKEGVQVGYARMVTDYATFAYLADVYVEDAHRGQSLAKKMIEILMAQEWTKKLRRLMLATLDAHGLYADFGFVQPAFPERYMEINRPVIYQKETSSAEENNQ